MLTFPEEKRITHSNCYCNHATHIHEKFKRNLLRWTRRDAFHTVLSHTILEILVAGPSRILACNIIRQSDAAQLCVMTH